MKAAGYCENFHPKTERERSKEDFSLRHVMTVMSG